MEQLHRKWLYNYYKKMKISSSVSTIMSIVILKILLNFIFQILYYNSEFII